jgi:hypothetical protein
MARAGITRITAMRLQLPLHRVSARCSVSGNAGQSAWIFRRHAGRVAIANKGASALRKLP